MARLQPAQLFPLEYELVTLARALVGAIAPRSAEYELCTPNALPASLSAAAHAALSESLREGGVLSLMQRGGALRELSCAAGGLRSGRVWETSEPPELHFGEYSYRLIEFLSSSACGDPECVPFSGFEPAGLGDELVAYLACDLLVSLGLPLAVARELPRQHPLVALAFPDTNSSLSAADCRAGMRRAVSEPLATLVRALGADLTRHLVRVHVRKLELRDPNELASLGAAEGLALSSFVAEAEQARREDLLSFIVRAGARLVPDAAPPQALAASWFHVEAERRADRDAARREATGLLRALAECGRIHERLRHVGFVDDEHERAQALLSSWEYFGRAGFSRSGALCAAIERPALAESA